MPSARDTGRTRPDTTTDPKRPDGMSPNPARPNLGQREAPTSKADREHTTHRRGLLTGTIAALLTGTAAVATARAASTRAADDDDAELLALYQRFLTHDAGIDAWNAGEIADEVGEAHNRSWWDCIDEMQEWTPATAAGVTAMADAALRCVEQCGAGRGRHDDFARHVLAEIAAWSAVA